MVKFYTTTFKQKEIMTTTRINPRPNEVFKFEEVQKFYKLYSSNYYIIEHGIDKSGKIYFVYSNGNVERFTRKQFINLSKNYHLD